MDNPVALIEEDLFKVKGLIEQGLRESNPAESSLIANQVVNIVQSNASKGKNINVVVQEVVVQQVIYNLTLSLHYIDKVLSVLEEVNNFIPVTGDSEDLNLKRLEGKAIIKALEKTGWVQKSAAKLLGISSRAILYKIENLGLKHPTWKKNKGEYYEETEDA